MGSNMAENHPIAFRFVMQAKERGATVIHVDPRFTRTSALADIYAPVRAGHRHRLPRRHHQLHPRARPVVPASTRSPTPTSPTIIDDGFQDAERARRPVLRLGRGERAATSTTPGSTEGDGGAVAARRALRQHRPRSLRATAASGWSRRRRRRTRRCSTRTASTRSCKRHYAALHAGDGRAGDRLPAGDLPEGRRGADAATPGRERTGAFCYAVGWTHHTTGVQMIRAAAIIQGLLGNIGRPGGGILALRGHCQHPGQHRHPDALQHAARLPAAAARAASRTRR